MAQQRFGEKVACNIAEIASWPKASFCHAGAREGLPVMGGVAEGGGLGAPVTVSA
jgi:hypothetical protein